MRKRRKKRRPTFSTRRNFFSVQITITRRSNVTRLQLVVVVVVIIQSLLAAFTVVEPMPLQTAAHQVVHNCASSSSSPICGARALRNASFANATTTTHEQFKLMSSLVPPPPPSTKQQSVLNSSGDSMKLEHEEIETPRFRPRRALDNNIRMGGE